MGLLCEFDVCEDFGFIAQTPEYGIVPDYSEGCEIFCETFIEVSQRIVPVDTGYLRSTLDADYSDTYCYAETICEYAQYVEYGTWRQRAQPYFEPALIEALNAAAGLWAEAQDAALMEEEMMRIEEMEAEEEEMMAMGYGGEDGESAVGAMAGAMLGGMIIGLITTFIYEAIGFAFMEREDRSSGGGGGSGGDGGDGGGGVYVPDVIIT